MVTTVLGRGTALAAWIVLLFPGWVQPSSQTAEPAPSLAGIRVAFKLDPRLIDSTYGGARWLSPPTFTSAVQSGKTGTVDVKVRGVDVRGKTVSIVPEWTAADPDLIAVKPGQNDEFRITVNGAGESTLTVASHGVSKKLLVRAKDLGNAVLVEISQNDGSGRPPQNAPAPAATDTGSTTQTTVPHDEKERNSYSMGVEMGKKLKAMPLELDADLVSRGVKDALSGEDFLFTEEDMETALAALRVDFRTKQLKARKELAEKNRTEGEAFLASNREKKEVVTLESGLQYRVLKMGDGPKPTAEDRVLCHYRGTLMNGKEFDSSYEGKKPRTFSLRRAIQGWNEALQLMPVGSKWELFIPPQLAYGERGARGIGPEETLIFEVELLAIQDREETSSR